MENLLFGFSNSMFQSSKIGDCGESNWTESIKESRVKPPKSELIKISHWDNWKSDILKMKNEFCVNTYRISIEWSHIEPENGKYNHEVLTRYKQISEFCNSLKIEIMFTLHHFTEPLWFSKIGGFEIEDNIEYFIQFCMYVFSNLHTVAKLWCTFNEPAIYAFMGYLLGGFPPHNHNLFKTLNVLKNLLITHTRLYIKMKEFDESCNIGIVHNVLIFKQLYTYDFIAYNLINFFNKITNDLVIAFFKTGVFEYKSFLHGINIHYFEPNAKHMNDFIGLNFYANPVVGPNSVNFYGPTYFEGQEMGDMYLPLDTIGFSNAIELVSSLNLPIFITEIGIADQTDKLREKFVVEYLNVIKKNIDAGKIILGCYFWTYRDNYEWGQTEKLFGFHNFEGNPKSSCEILRNEISNCLLEYDFELNLNNDNLNMIVKNEDYTNNV